MRPHAAAPPLALAVALVLAGCGGGRPAPQPSDEPRAFMEEWMGDGVVAYRLVSKDDFQAESSNARWGVFKHAAEICTQILPTPDYDETGAFRAVMRPDCSYWNEVIGPLGRAGRLALAAAGVLTIGGGKQPDWYVLQHEQVHFAINEVAARRLTRSIAHLPPERRSLDLTRRVYELTVQHANQRQQKFDAETSGTYDPFLLEKWVRMLQRELDELCDTDHDCRVRLGS
jgi:hypothetical protein